MEHKTLPHPTIIKKMQTFLELEGKLGPKPQALRNQFRPSQPDTNPKIRKNGKAAENRKRPTPTKRFKVEAWPDSDKTTAKSSITKAPINTKNQETQAQTSQNNSLPLEDAPIHSGNLWPEAGRMSGNLFEIRKDWLTPPNNMPMTKTVTQPQPPTQNAP